ncbi:MAG: OsmC family protein [Bacteroidota bacterium]
MNKIHNYNIEVKWTGNDGQGTKAYNTYSRDHEIRGVQKMCIPGSSDPSFLGDKKRYNPEELFLASISSCHMLWYLHLCTSSEIIVVDYLDQAEGYMEETAKGSGHFTQVILHPEITLLNKDKIREAEMLHHRANEMCFIANSCNFEIKHSPIILVRA